MATWCPLTHILTSSTLAWRLQHTPTFAIWQLSKTLLRPGGQAIQQPTASHLPPAPALTWKILPHSMPRFSNICLGNDHLEIGPQPNRATAPAWRLRCTPARRNFARPSTSCCFSLGSYLGSDSTGLFIMMAHSYSNSDQANIKWSRGTD